LQDGQVVPVGQAVAGRIELAEYDPTWPRTYAREARRIRDALGDRLLRIEHVGSTSVPVLAAKPIVDIVIEVADAADEDRYGPALESAGFALRIREPDWFSHRLFRDVQESVNLHVFSEGCSERDRMVRFRNVLRGSDAERDRYARAKHELATRQWTSVQRYADVRGAIAQSWDRKTGSVRSVQGRSPVRRLLNLVTRNRLDRCAACGRPLIDGIRLRDVDPSGSLAYYHQGCAPSIATRH